MTPQRVTELLEKPDVYWLTMPLEGLGELEDETLGWPEDETLKQQARRHQLSDKILHHWSTRLLAEVSLALDGPEEGGNVVSLR